MRRVETIVIGLGRASTTLAWQAVQWSPGIPSSPIAYFNGLGSKGSLLAPFFAEQVAVRLTGEREGETSPTGH